MPSVSLEIVELAEGLSISFFSPENVAGNVGECRRSFRPRVRVTFPPEPLADLVSLALTFSFLGPVHTLAGIGLPPAEKSVRL